MQVIYSDQSLVEFRRQSIFLAGPTEREDLSKSWRKEALILLEELEYAGTVCIPEPLSGIWPDFAVQVEWEWQALHGSRAICFWVTRRLPDLLGLTTNCEFGYYLGRNKPLFYGRPDGAPHTRYLDWLGQKHHAPSGGIWPVENDLKEVLRKAVDFVNF